MSIQAMAWAWKLDLSSTQKFILVALADHADDDGICWPGQKGIAKKCGLTRATVNAHIRAMVDVGVLSLTNQHRPDGSLTSNLYCLNLTSFLQGSQPSIQGVVKEIDKVVQEIDEGSQPIIQQEPSLEPSLNRHIEPSVSPSSEKPRSANNIHTLSSEATQRLRDRFKDTWSEADIDERIRFILGHQAAHKWTDVEAGVLNWLKGDAERSNGNGTYRRYSAFTQRKDASNGGGSPKDIPRETSPFAKYRGASSTS